VLKLSPFPDGVTLQVVYLAMGLAILLVLRRVLVRLGLRPAATLIAVGLVAIYPAMVVLENLPTYDYPTILLLLWLVLVVCRFAQEGDTRTFALLVTVAAAIVLLRTIFHPIWFVVLVAGVLLVKRPQIGLKRGLLIAAAPALIILAFLVKNQVLYGQFGLSTWFGPSLSKISASVVDKAELKQLQSKGEVSPIFGKPVFFGYDTYAANLPACQVEHADVEVLADPVRHRSGTPNLDYWCQLAVYRQQQKDALSFIRHHPAQFADAEMAGTQMYFEPAAPIIYTKNVQRLDGVDDVFERVVFGRVQLAPVTDTTWGEVRVLAHGGVDLLVLVLLADLLAVCMAVVGAIRLRRGERDIGNVAWLTVGFIVLWTTLTGSWFEINENARYRLLVDPLLIGVLVWAVDRGVAALQARRAPETVGK
jgi:hypothetical protein